MEAWLEAIPQNSAISVYVHIPFCKRLCWFCACRTQGLRSQDPIRRYLTTLKAEIALLADKLPSGITLSRLHWGGGTPTILSPDQMRDLHSAITRVLPMDATGEFSVEIDPTEADDERLDALAECGMNRASIGVQDFAPHIQKVIGREQSFEITLDVALKLRARGVKSLNTDILYGLPFQNTQSITDTTNMLLELEPDRVALYGYAHVPWMARRQTMIPEEALPLAEDRLALYDTARSLFENKGYCSVGIDHFAKADDGLEIARKNGRLRRNFQGYTDDPAEVLIGLGASSISRFPQGYIQNAAATAAYQARIREGFFAAARGHEFTQEDLLRARVIEELMCQFEFDLSALEAELGISKPDLRLEIERVHRKFEKYTERTQNGLAIKPEGRPLTRMIATEFDAYSLAKAGHSAAI